MSESVLTLIIPLVSAAISALFWALMREKDRQITDKDKRIETLEGKVEALQNVVTKNTDSLDRVAQAMETQNRLHQYGLQAANPSTPLPNDPA